MMPPQTPVLPPPTDRGFVPPLNPMMPPPQQTNVEIPDFSVAQGQPPRIIPGGGGRQFAPAPALQPGLFSMMNSMFGGGG